MFNSSIHHSFDINLAQLHGIEEAILIHHFAHWIKVNRTRKKNFHEGRTWTYMTFQDIADHFPYLTRYRVRHTVRSLCKKGILILKNFNKRPGDNTNWFSFQDEARYVPFVDETEKADFYRESENSQGGGQAKLPGVRQNCPGSGKIARALPDTKTDTKKEKKEEGAKAPESTPEAIDVCDFLLEKIKEKNPKFKEPRKEKWVDEICKIIRIDKRTPEDLKKVLEWANAHESKFWATVFQSPSTLRKLFDRAWSELNFVSKEEREKKEKEKKEKMIAAHRKWAQKSIKPISFPHPEKSMWVADAYVRIKNGGEESILAYDEPKFADIITNKLVSWGYKIVK